MTPTPHPRIRKSPDHQAQFVVVARASEEFREATDRLGDILEKRARSYRKEPSSERRLLRLNNAMAWIEHVQKLVDCSCPDCWNRGPVLLEIVDRIEDGELPEVEAWACAVRSC